MIENLRDQMALELELDHKDQILLAHAEVKQSVWT
jgi:hypothetical protein